MPRGYLALLIELHHPLPGPGQPIGDDWACAAVETYWPLLRAISALVDGGLDEALTIAVSPSWTALAADTAAQALAIAELDRRAGSSPGRSGGREALAPAEHWHALRAFAVDRWQGDLLAPLRRAGESGSVELIPTAASHAWLPGVAVEPVVACAQVHLAADDHAHTFGAPAAGLWLPHLAYLPGLEKTLAASGLRYFGVDAFSFRRGTVRPPADLFGPLVTTPGTAAFGVDPGLAQCVAVPEGRYARDPRYGDPAQSAHALGEHVAHFIESWRGRLEHAPHPHPHPPVCITGLSAHDLGGLWWRGADWLELSLRRLSNASPWALTTPGRYLDRFPDAPVGRPGPSAGGLLTVRPGGSDLIDRCHLAAEVLADAVDRRSSYGPLGRRALAQMTRLLLRAQSLDWHLPPGHGLPTDEGLARASHCLTDFAELAGLLAAGRLSAGRIAALEAGPAYLCDLDVDRLVDA